MVVFKNFLFLLILEEMLIWLKYIFFFMGVDYNFLLMLIVV